MRKLRFFLLLLLVCTPLLGGTVRPAQATSYHAQGLYRFKDFAAVYHHGLFHIFAIHECPRWALPGTCDPTRRGFLHLTSPDLTNWTEVGFILAPDERSWRSYDVWAPSIVERDGTYYMFYTAVEHQANGLLVQRISIATSTDLYTWSDERTEPVFSCESFDWSYWNLTNTDGVSGDCRDPYVAWDEGGQQWMMFVSARTRDDGAAPPWIVHPMAVGIATSTDLEHWTTGQVLTNTRGHVTESSHVFSHDGSWYLAWTSNTSIKYAVGSAMAGPYEVVGNLPNVSTASFATEVLQLGNLDVLIYPQSGIDTLEFRQLGWTAEGFSVDPIGYGTLLLEAWNDDNADGIRGVSEPWLNGVPAHLYRDNGDGEFSPTSDSVYADMVTGDDPATTSIIEQGCARRATLLPGRYFVTVDQAATSPGGALEGMDAGGVRTFDIASGQTQTVHLGLTVPTGSGEAPEVPVVAAPVDGQTIAGFTPRFEFSSADPEGDTVIYDIQIDRVPTFDSDNLRLARLRGSTTGWSGLDQGVQYGSGSPAAFTPSRLGNGQYYWRVRAMDPIGSRRFSDFSPALSLTTPPALTISAVTVTLLDSDSISLAWQSSQPGSSNVWYSEDSDYYLSAPGPTTQHLLTLDGLTTGSNYTFSVWTTDSYGQTAVSSEAIFTTVPEPPVTISDVRVYAGTTSAMITWTTNRPATSVLSYGSSAAYGQITTDATSREYHAMTLSGLAPSRYYYYRIEAATGTTAIWTGTFRTNSNLYSPGSGLRRPLMMYPE